MATLTIKNIPDSLYSELKKKAASNHRSLNSEAILSLVQSVHQSGVSSKDILSKARELRVKANSNFILNDNVINDAKNQGRS